MRVRFEVSEGNKFVMLKMFRKISVFAVLAVLLVYSVIVAYMYLSQERMVFFPQHGGRELAQTPAKVGLAFESVTLDAEDGNRIHGWFVPHSDSQGSVLYFHGNAGNIGRRLVPIKRWHDLGLSVFIIDYPGFGESTGKPSEEGSYAAARSAWHFLTRSRNFPAHDIVIFGRSLGGGVASQLASEVQAKALILDSSFTSVPDVAARHYPWLPVQSMMHVRFETINRLASIRYPVLFLHSPDDTVVPYSHAEENFAAANEPKQFVVLRGRHNDAPSVSEPYYSAAISEFLGSIELTREK